MSLRAASKRARCSASRVQDENAGVTASAAVPSRKQDTPQIQVHLPSFLGLLDPSLYRCRKSIRMGIQQTSRHTASQIMSAARMPCSRGRILLKSVGRLDRLPSLVLIPTFQFPRFSIATRPRLSKAVNRAIAGSSPTIA